MNIETLAKANELSNLVTRLKEIEADIIINRNKYKNVKSIIINYEDFDRPVYININIPSADRLQILANVIQDAVSDLISADQKLFNDLS